MNINLICRLGALSLLALLTLNSQIQTAHAQGTAFTYQGRLNSGGAPANGSYDIAFTLYTTNVTGSALIGPVTNSAVAVTNGLFTTLVDFGPGVFTGTSNWLAIAVSTNGANNFSTLAPRQRVTPVPYALYAGSVNASNLVGTVPAMQLPANVLTNGATGVNLSGTFNFTGGGPTNLSGWLLNGNSGTTNGNYLGTTDNQPLEIRVAGARAALISPSNGLPNIVFGPSQNVISNTTAGASILGGSGNMVEAGSSYSVIGGGSGNTIQIVDDHSVIGGGINNSIQFGANLSVLGGGQGNVIGSSAFASFLGGGIGNEIYSGASYSFIGGGNANDIWPNAYQSVIGGGNGNTIQSGSVGSFIGSGIDNNIQANDIYSVLGGGNENVIWTGATFSFLGGGQFNYLQTGAINSVLGGGTYNVIMAGYSFLGGGNLNTISNNATYAVLAGGFQNGVGGSYATVPGGSSNLANGPYSFAAGKQAQALNSGAFVWSDASGTPFASLAANTFNVRASGGVRFVTGGAGVTVDGQPISGGGGGGFWTTGGNAGANPTNGAFLGTIDNLPLEFRVNGSRALRLEPGGPSAFVGNGIPTGAPNVVGGSPLNFVASGAVGAVIGGGGATNYFGTPYANGVASDFSFIGGGAGNFISTNAYDSVLGGGYANSIQTNAGQSFLGGGAGNTIEPNAFNSVLGGGVYDYIQQNDAYSVLVGGFNNSIQPNAAESVLGGGVDNSIQSYSDHSVLVGGNGNNILTNASFSFIGGGTSNSIQSLAGFSFVGGGGGNSIQPSAFYSVLNGGQNNTIANNSDHSVLCGGNSNSIGSSSYNSTIAGGYQNSISPSCNGATIAGGQLNSIANNNPNAFVAGGYGNQANGNCAFAAGNLATVANANSFVWSDGSATTTSTANQQFMARASGGVVFYTSSGTGSGVALAAGGGSWANLSDRNAKTDLAPVTGPEVLAQLAALPISRWSYKTEQGVTHLGPMAQDFYAAFGLGEDNRHITTVDEEGVALAAIQGLNQKVQENQTVIQQQATEIASLKAELDRLEQRLTQKSGTQPGLVERQ